MNIKFDYTYDNGFFNDPERREVLSYAGQLWSEIIGDDFDAIPAGSTFEIRHPSQNGKTIEITLAEDIDDLLIYVGARFISGPTLGLGGPSGYSLVGDKFALRISDDFRNQGATENFEPWAGVLTFDDNVKWNSSLKEPEPGENDLLTVALHEIGHVLGIGTASTFESLVQDQAFIGANAINLNGGVSVPLYEDEAHVEEGYSENNVLMDPTTTVGDRVLISEIDKAILSDLGYSITGFLNNSATFSLTSNVGETVYGTKLDDHIDALSGDDVVFANDGNDQIVGGAGDDQLQGGVGNDCIYGEIGVDFLLGQDGSDKLFGGDGADELQGGMGGDLLVGGKGDDNLDGDEGDDILFGSLGTDYIQSGDGDDIIVSSLGIDHIATGAGADDIYAFCNGNDTWLNDFSIGVDSLYLVGSEIISKDAFLETEIEEFANYWTFKLPSATTLRIVKLDENDSLVDANIFLKSSTDVAGMLPQVIFGSDTDDLISGDVSRDRLYAGEGADFVSAGAGDDTIELWSSSVYQSRSYAHNVTTSARLSVNEKTKYSTVIDGEADADTIVLMDSLNGDAFFLHDAYSNLHQSVTTIVDDKGMQTAARVINIETIFAGSGDDIIDLTSDTFDMGGTNITLKGEAGDDVLWAAEGNDTLEGGAGNDTLFGGDGNDTLTGGSGADVFEFAHSNTSQSDTITDYTSDDILKFYLSDGDSQITEADYQSGTLSWGNMTITLDNSLNWEDLNIVNV